jgi:hypothetical protein
VRLSPDIKSGVITGNRFAGIPQIKDEKGTNVQIGMNAGIEPPTEEEGSIVIDNMDAPPHFKTEGEWYEGQGGGDYRGLCHWAYRGDGSAKAYWSPDIPRTGKYEVYVWYGKDPQNNHATDAVYAIKHKDRIDEVEVNLRKHKAQWYLLGTYEFERGNESYVMTSNNANDNVVADAVKFVPVIDEKDTKKKRKRFLGIF